MPLYDLQEGDELALEDGTRLTLLAVMEDAAVFGLTTSLPDSEVSDPRARLRTMPLTLPSNN